MSVKNSLLSAVIPVVFLLAAGGTPGAHTQTFSFSIEGVVLLNEQPPGDLASIIEVELTTERGGEGMRTVVRESGEYKFGGLPSSSVYVVTARAPGYRSATSRIEINNVGQIRGVTRLLLVSEAPPPRVTHDGEIVSQNALRAPGRARKEVEEAQAALASGDLKRAEKAVAEALGLFPDYGQALYLKGRLLEARGQPQQAAHFYSDAIARDPDVYPAYARLCEIYRAGRQHEPLKSTAEQWKKMQALEAAPLYYLAVAKYELGDYRAASEEAYAAKRLPHSNLPHLLLVLANCHMRLRETEAAAVHLAEFLKLHPEDALAPQARETLEQLKRLTEGR